MFRTRRARARSNSGWFRRGVDPRRHQLTEEERYRGGMRAWYGTMAELRMAMNLPLPLPQLRAAAEKLLAKRGAELERLRKERGL